MSKSAGLPVYQFRVWWMGLDGVAREDVVEAAYYQEAGRFTQLKDDGHVVVVAYRTDGVMRVQRLGESSDDVG